MSRGVNKVILVGNLGKDPEVRSIDNGAKVASFSLATAESYNDRNGNRVDQTEWHNIVLWRGLADVADRFLKKGSRIYIEGKIKTRSYDDKDGNKRYITEIVGDNMVMLDGRESSGGSGDYQSQRTAPEPASSSSGSQGQNPTDDDLPF